MRIGILGAGSLGSAMGGALARSGNDVFLVARPAHVKAINEHGLVMVETGEESTVTLDAFEGLEGIEPADLLIVLTKAFDTESVLTGIESLLHENTMVMSLQNGMGAEDIIRSKVDEKHMIGGRTYVGGVMVEPGKVIAGIPTKKTIIGEFDGSVSERIQAVAKTFNDAGLETEISTNVTGLIWDKLLINVCTGAISGITRLCYGELLKEPEIKNTALQAVQEGIDVALAAGISLTRTNPEDVWNVTFAGLPYEFKASILQSIEKGSRTEIDYINGSVVREGKRLGVSTPVNETLVSCLTGIEKHMGVR